MKFKQLENTFRLLGGRKRLEILRLLSDRRPRAVGDIADHVKLSLKATSKHVLLLAQGDVLERQRDKQVVRYYINHDIPEPTRSVFKFISSAS